ncbi:hypothetical protein [Oceaniglobus ichthyenteri]|uniref:hypothetical protein n=1 Tax=Oceaniglobus ichthyenteri TaxID=2136177 RepID=UPI000D33E2A6|nr:hypothetical protein [Oceaniglobus ichthyenteri]
MCDDTFDLAPLMRRLAGLVLLAGCAAAPMAPPTAPEPRQAIMYRNTVTVQFSDGALCVAKRPGTARAWDGTLAGCPHLLPYRVTLPGGGLAPRQVLVRLPGGGVRVIAVGDAAFGLPGAGL